MGISNSCRTYRNYTHTRDSALGLRSCVADMITVRNLRPVVRRQVVGFSGYHLENINLPLSPYVIVPIARVTLGSIRVTANLA